MSDAFHYCKTHDRKAVPACWNSVGTPIEGHGRICEIVTYLPNQADDPGRIRTGNQSATAPWRAFDKEPRERVVVFGATLFDEETNDV